MRQLGVTVSLLAMLSILAAPLAAEQIGGATADDWVPSRTADGQPALQGTWNHTTITTSRWTDMLWPIDWMQ